LVGEDVGDPGPQPVGAPAAVIDEQGEEFLVEEPVEHVAGGAHVDRRAEVAGLSEDLDESSLVETATAAGLGEQGAHVKVGRCPADHLVDRRGAGDDVHRGVDEHVTAASAPSAERRRSTQGRSTTATAAASPAIEASSTAASSFGFVPKT
jgi:hypothetical protein